MNTLPGNLTDSFDKLKVSVRLAAGFGLVLALLCVIAALSAAQLGRIADNTRTYAASLVPSYEVEHNVSIGLGNIRRYELQHILSNSDSEMADIEARVDDFYDRIQADLERFAQHVPADDQGKRFLAVTRSAAAAYLGQWERVRTVSRMKAQYPSKIAEATRLSSGDSAKAYDDAHAAVAAWWAYNVKLANEQAVSAERTYLSGKVVLASLTLVAILLGGLAAILITRSIVRQLGGEPDYAVAVADQIAKGNLRVEVRLGEGDSTSLLAAIKTMRDRLDGIVGQVRESADSIATGTAQIASGNIDLSQRTEEQNNSLQQTTASLQQLSVAVKASADAAGYASEAAARASETASNGGQVVDKVVATMSQIAGSSRKIASIIGVIDDIAFQTNILALNAAVEAARAGDQGRGFAVVANEVRSLAGRSAEAAKEIKSLIGASVDAVDRGASQVVEAGESMTAIVTQVHRVSELVADISRSTVEQSSGIGQVGDSMHQLDGVTQQNAALVEQSAAAAESLRHQAETLASLVSLFQVASSSRGVPATPAFDAPESGAESLSFQAS